MSKKIINSYYTVITASNAVELPGNIRPEELLLITDVTNNVILYNFAEPSKGYSSVTYSPESKTTTVVLTYPLSSAGTDDNSALQITVDEQNQKIGYADYLLDPVDKVRVTNPQSLIDTDFEYSLQPFKWETVELINNRPSVYNKANEPFLTSDQVSSITVEIADFGGGGSSSFTEITAPAQTDITGFATAAIGGDDTHRVIPTPWPVELDGNSYNYLWISSNSFFSYLQTPSAPSYQRYSARANSPAAPTFFVYSGDFPNSVDTSGSIAYYGQRVVPGYGNCFVVRWQGGNVYFNQSGRVWEAIFPQNNPKQVYVNLIQGTPQINGGQYPNRQVLAISNGNGGWLTDFFYGDTHPFGTAIGYGLGGITVVQANIRTTAPHGRLVGDPILIKESLNTVQIDGAYIVSQVPSDTEFQLLLSDSTGLQTTPISGTYDQTATQNYITVTAADHPYRIGSSIFFDTGLTADPLTGIYEVLPIPAPTANTFAIPSPDLSARSGNVDVTENFRGSYTSIYSGGFFENSEISVLSVTSVSGTANAKISFESSHGLFIGTPIYVIDNSQPTAAHVGGFNISKVLNDKEVEYTTRSGQFTTSELLSDGANTLLYIRPEGNASHRIYDGGVQIATSTPTANAQIIRQTRKYFRYQSGKGIQFSTGILFCPTYDINSIQAEVVGSDTFLTINTEQEHGFIAPKPGIVLSPTVRLYGFEVSSGQNIYNGDFKIFNVSDKKTFVIKIEGQQATDLNPGGDAFVEVRDWYDASVRTGLFDEQNGLFFEHDGQTLWAVKRSATFQLRGTVTAITGSPKIYGYQTNFLSSLDEGDYINVRGMSYFVTKILSDTELEITPEYRGTANAGNVKVTKVIEERFPQSEFNIDKVDGSGPSGYVFDRNKMQMVYIDYSWYGAGKIRWGMRVSDGTVKYVHELENNNRNTEAYMRSGNLPGRFEIANRSKKTKLSNSTYVSAASFSYNGSFSYDIFINLPNHGLEQEDTFLVSNSNNTSLLPNGYYKVTSYIDQNTILTQIQSPDRDPVSGSLDLSLALTSSVAAPFVLPVEDASLFPDTGVVLVNNEYLKYEKIDDTSLTILERNLYGRESNANASSGDTLTSTNQNFSPALSHWGTSVIMDGRFDIDKSYLFTAINRGTFSVSPGNTTPLVSLRLAPSVDYGVARGFGIRNLINRSLLTLDTVGVAAQRNFLITCKLNSEASAFENEDNWIEAGNGSIAQYFDHSLISTPDLSSGDTIFEFFADDGNNRYATTERQLNVVRELSNSILGGNNIFPDGPDILTVYATNLSSQSGGILGRVSWSESQG
jgi:hypothetical protein